jgi:hypothetical protein
MKRFVRRATGGRTLRSINPKAGDKPLSQEEWQVIVAKAQETLDVERLFGRNVQG